MQYLGIYSYELCLIIIIYLTSCRVSSIGMTCEHLVNERPDSQLLDIFHWAN